MDKAKRLVGTSLMAGGIALSAAPAAAQTTISNRGLPTLDQIKPLPASYRSYSEPNPGFLHNFKLSVDVGAGLVEKRNQPTKLKQNSYGTQLGLSFGIGSMGFASVSGTYSRENIKSTILAFPLAMDAGADAYGFDAVLGIAPVPFLRAGVILGAGVGSSSYQFVGVPAAPVGAKSDGYRYGAFVGGTYATGALTLTLDAAVLATRNRQEYDPGNIPPVAHFGSTIGLLTFGASYDVTTRLRLTTSVTINHVLEEMVAPAERGLDKTWFALQAGVGYMLTERWEVTAKGTTWLANDRMRYHRASVGASYKF